MSAFLSGFPNTTCLSSVNRFSASSLESIATIAAKIKGELLDCGIAASVESISMFDFDIAKNIPKLSNYNIKSLDYL